jgi:hypothetical protein
MFGSTALVRSLESCLVVVSVAVGRRRIVYPIIGV